MAACAAAVVLVAAAALPRNAMAGARPAAAAVQCAAKVKTGEDALGCSWLTPQPSQSEQATKTRRAREDRLQRTADITNDLTAARSLASPGLLAPVHRTPHLFGSPDVVARCDDLSNESTLQRPTLEASLLGATLKTEQPDEIASGERLSSRNAERVAAVPKKHGSLVSSGPVVLVLPPCS